MAPQRAPNPRIALTEFSGVVQKSIRRLIDENPNLVLVVGDNDSGKTSFMANFAQVTKQAILYNIPDQFGDRLLGYNKSASRTWEEFLFETYDWVFVDGIHNAHLSVTNQALSRLVQYAVDYDKRLWLSSAIIHVEELGNRIGPGIGSKLMKHFFVVRL